MVGEVVALAPPPLVVHVAHVHQLVLQLLHGPHLRAARGALHHDGGLGHERAALWGTETIKYIMFVSPHSGNKTKHNVEFPLVTQCLKNALIRMS